MLCRLQAWPQSWVPTVISLPAVMIACQETHLGILYLLPPSPPAPPGMNPKGLETQWLRGAKGAHEEVPQVPSCAEVAAHEGWRSQP